MKKILIIGAGFLQKFVICKAKELGYETFAVDANPDAIGFQYADHYAVINIVDEKACLEYAQQEKVDGVLTAATDYGVLTASYIAQEMQLPGLKYDVAKLIKNKYRVRKCLFECCVDDTGQAYEVDKETDLDALCSKLKFPVIVKPCDGSGSRGTSRVNTEEEFVEACLFAMDSSITQRAEIETFIVGKEYGAESLVVNGEVYVLGIMKKWMTSPPFYAELGHSIPTDLSPEIEERVKQCVRNAIKALDINFGSVNMDILITLEGTIHIIDIGARMGGNLIGSHIIPYGTGIDYMGNMIRNAVGDEVDLTTNSHGMVATRILALKPGVVKELPNFNKIQSDYDVMIEQHINIGDEITPYRTNLDGCGYVVACGSDSNLNIEKAEKVRVMIDKLIVREENE